MDPSHYSTLLIANKTETHCQEVFFFLPKVKKIVNRLHNMKIIYMHNMEITWKILTCVQESFVLFVQLHLAFIQIPKEINWKANIIQGTDLWGWQMAVSDLFEERPIWPKDALTDRLLDKNLKFTHQTLRRYSF